MAKRFETTWSPLNSDIFYIYMISRKDTDEVFYVGITRDLRNRSTGHTSDKNKSNTIVGSYIRDLKSKGVSIKVDLLETCPFSEVKGLERYWIWQFRSWGMPMQNAQLKGLGWSLYKRKND